MSFVKPQKNLALSRDTYFFHGAETLSAIRKKVVRSKSSKLSAEDGDVVFFVVSVHGAHSRLVHNARACVRAGRLKPHLVPVTERNKDNKT